MASTRPSNPTSHPAKVIRAGAQQVKTIKGTTYGVKREGWQDDAWDVYDQIGEMKQGTNFIADVCAGVVLFIAITPDSDDQNPVPATSADVGYAEAIDVLERIRVGSVEGGTEGFVRESVINLKVAGDMYVLAEDAVPPDPAADTVEGRTGRPEQWSVLSVSEIDVKRGFAEVRDTPKGKPRRVRLPDETQEIGGEGDFAFLVRIWQRHPRYGGLADCMMRALLLESDELLLLSRVIRGSARSRLAQAGILIVPSEYSFASTTAEEGDSTEDPEVDAFMVRLGQAMLEAVEDESSPEGLVPIVVRAPSTAIAAAGITHVALTTPVADRAADDRKDLLTRIGNSSDIPWEQVTGMGDSNHWSAWQIDNASWGRYGQATMRVLCQAWTQGILWPHLDAAGIAPELARRLIVWFDPANAIVDPDAGKTADELFDRGGISWEAHRQRKGADETEAPTDEELDRRSQLGLLKGGSPQQGGGGMSENSPPAENGNATTASAAPLTAAARRPIGRVLANIDGRLRTSLAEVAEAAVARALEKAGAKVRTASRRIPSMQASIADVAAIDVTARFGPSAVAAVGLTEDELVGDTVEGYAARFETKIRQAQTQARKELRRRFRMTDDETDELEARQDRERKDAVAWLVGALTSLARERLFNPATAPTAGEFDASARVPASIGREAMSRAGGGSMSGVGTPDGGTATGVDVMAIWTAHGATLSGWEWDWSVGGDRNAFPAHEALDGVAFSSWSDPVLAVQEQDSWIGRDFYQPGDHAGCLCSFVPLGGDEPDEAEAAE